MDYNFSYSHKEVVIGWFWLCIAYSVMQAIFPWQMELPLNRTQEAQENDENSQTSETLIHNDDVRIQVNESHEESQNKISNGMSLSISG